jgi:hypothetical protein
MGSFSFSRVYVRVWAACVILCSVFFFILHTAELLQFVLFGNLKHRRWDPKPDLPDYPELFRGYIRCCSLHLP